jgi:hypothetical protein
MKKNNFTLKKRLKIKKNIFLQNLKNWRSSQSQLMRNQDFVCGTSMQRKAYCKCNVRASASHSPWPIKPGYG